MDNQERAIPKDQQFSNPKVIMIFLIGNINHQGIRISMKQSLKRKKSWIRWKMSFVELNLKMNIFLKL